MDHPEDINRNIAQSSNPNSPKPLIDNILLNPLVQERVVEVPVYEYKEKIVHVPQIEKVTRYEEIPTKIREEKIIQKIKPVIEERIRHVPKIVYEDKTVTVHQVKVVDKVVDVPQYVYREKVLEVPQVLVQERVVPVPKKIYKEQLVELPSAEFLKLQEASDTKSTESDTVTMENPALVNIPHTQHTYRHIITPEYRHIPQPVQVPMTHYKPIPVHKIVDRNVPIPVELVIVQEYLCPRVEPVFKEVPIPIQCQRIIEHPVPKEALHSPHLLPLYYVPPGTKVQNDAALFLHATHDSNTSQQDPNAVEILAQGAIPHVA